MMSEVHSTIHSQCWLLQHQLLMVPQVRMKSCRELKRNQDEFMSSWKRKEIDDAHDWKNSE